MPTLAQADELHRRLAPSPAAYDLIHGHCVVVAELTRMMVRQHNALIEGSPGVSGIDGGLASASDRPLHEDIAVVGAMLHDIGTYRVLADDGSDGKALRFDGPRYILHGLLGYEWLLDLSVDESMAQFARNHTGVGLDREQVERQGLPLPIADYTPRTTEQEVVMVADKYHSKSIPPRFLTAGAYGRKAARFGEANRRRWESLVRRYGTPDVQTLARRFHMAVEDGRP